jgi:hypothetical protein
VKLKEMVYLIASAIFSLIIANLGGKLLKDFPESPYFGWSTIIIAFLAFLFFSYTVQIRENQDKLKELEMKIAEMKRLGEVDKELLNRIRDIVLLAKLDKIKK